MYDERSVAATGQANGGMAAAQGLLFVREKLWLITATSAAVMLPCFWHRRIEAGDLSSHTYNAWLTQLIAHGQAQGLYLACQCSNILMDVALVRLGNVVGLAAAEKIVVGVSVLIFFWGAFALIAAAAGRAPWFLVPGIAMVAYGWTFQMGFMNYYLSVGLAFWVIALWWRGRRADWIIGLALAGLVLSAHVMGFIWLVGAATYIKFAERMRSGRWVLFIAALLAIFGVHSYVAHHYRTYDPVTRHVYYFLGFDQLVLFGSRYRALAMVVLFLAVVTVVLGVIRERSSECWRTIRTPLELWATAVFAAAMLWADISIPKYATGFTYVVSRLTSVTAVLGLSILGCVPPRRWHLVAFAASAAVFFAWMYQDTGMLNRMEEQTEKLVGGLPYGIRVIQTIWVAPRSRIGAEHIVERACIGRCFAYANYEPSTRQFRVRVGSGGSTIVVSSPADGLAMSEGRYVVRAEDLPMAQIYQCDNKDLSKLCIRDLTVGEVNGRLGYHPPNYNRSQK